jgi:maltooligosyltrehalose trehalohydrolase
MLFQGEEWAASTPFQYFTQHEDEDLGRAVSKGRRSEFVDFGWDPQQVPDPQHVSTFQASKLRWDELAGEPHAEMLDWYQRLIALRRATGNFTDGDLESLKVRFDENARWLVAERGPYSTVCNFAEDPRCVPVRPVAAVLAASDRIEPKDCGVWMPDESVAIIQHSEAG